MDAGYQGCSSRAQGERDGLPRVPHHWIIQEDSMGCPPHLRLSRCEAGAPSSVLSRGARGQG
jgi:hypothetical protein